MIVKYHLIVRAFMLIKALTISDKGQIVIPKELVKHLGSKVIKLEMSNNHEVRIIPIKDVAGSLTEFAQKPTSTTSKPLRDQALDQTITKKFNKD